MTCKLPDEIDITLFANKYVSTLGDELGFDESDYDPQTGFPTVSVEDIFVKACELDLCGFRSGCCWSRLWRIFTLRN